MTALSAITLGLVGGVVLGISAVLWINRPSYKQRIRARYRALGIVPPVL